MTGYRIQPIALHQAEEIVKYIYRESGIDKSREFFHFFRDSAKLIGQFPRYGVHIYPHTSIELRRAPMPHPYRRYLMYWKVVDESAIITSIWHESKEEPPTHVLR